MFDCPVMCTFTTKKPDNWTTTYCYRMWVTYCTDHRKDNIHWTTQKRQHTLDNTEKTTYIGQHRKDNIHWTTQKRQHTLDNTEKTTYIGQHRKDNIHWTTQKRQHTLDNTEKTTYIGGTLPDGYVTFCSSINFFATTIGFLIPEIYNYKSFL